MKPINLILRTAVALAMLAGLSQATRAADVKKKEFVAITPEEAGADFKIQGEYEGLANGAKLGAQVIDRKSVV